MNRPRYEVAEDRAKEEAVAARVFSQFVRHKLPDRYSVDWALFKDGTLYGWAEIKCRNKFYPRPFVSLGKVMEGLRLANNTGTPFFLVFQFPDGIFAKRIKETDLERGNIMHGGRQDRGDWQDMEPVILFDIKSFTQIPNEETQNG